MSEGTEATATTTKKSAGPLVPHPRHLPRAQNQHIYIRQLLKEKHPEHHFQEQMIVLVNDLYNVLEARITALAAAKTRAAGRSGVSFKDVRDGIAHWLDDVGMDAHVARGITNRVVLSEVTLSKSMAERKARAPTKPAAATDAAPTEKRKATDAAAGTDQPSAKRAHTE